MTEIKISPAVLDMKFMQRTKKKLELRKAKQQAKAERERMFGSAAAETSEEPSTDRPKVILEPSYQKLADLKFGRMSFNGFNPEVEKLMVYHERVRLGEDVYESDDEVDIGDVEMAETLGSTGLKKKLLTKAERAETFIDESPGDKDAPKRHMKSPVFKHRGKRGRRY